MTKALSLWTNMGCNSSRAVEASDDIYKFPLSALVPPVLESKASLLHPTGFCHSYEYVRRNVFQLELTWRVPLRWLDSCGQVGSRS